MFKLMGKEINAIFGAQTILIRTYVTRDDGHGGSSLIALPEYMSKKSTDTLGHTRHN